ncbi:MAG: aldehyde dehydrogenase family protein, partial [Pseudobdellovibrionaceae bacterium]|nr:aldehyde dehydrogenase family protein [Pseudobdellovibrionaceae bacterium]
MSLDLKFLKDLGITKENAAASTGTEWFGSKQKGSFASYSPVDGQLIGNVYKADRQDYEKIIKTAEAAALKWRQVPAPQRGEIVRQMGDKLRQLKEPLGKLVAYEMGKSLQEGLGEVQEMIDIC